MTSLPNFRVYYPYHSVSYGAHALQFFTSTGTFWFSYHTLVAFKSVAGSRVVHVNDWGTTTGKHLNAIDGGDKVSRVDAETFKRLYVEAFGISCKLTTLEFELLAALESIMLIVEYLLPKHQYQSDQRVCAVRKVIAKVKEREL